MLKNKGIIIITFDDILAYNTYDLYTYLCQNYTFYSKYLNLYKLYTKQEIYDRPKKDLISFLFNQDSYNRLSNDGKRNALNNLYTTLYLKYYSVDRYTMMKPSIIASKILTNPLFSENSGIDKVYILTKYKSNLEKEAKINFIKNNFDNPKINIKCLKYDDEYEKYINEINRWDLLITDDINTVESLSKKDIDHREFLLPEYGYDVASPELLELIKQKSGSISYYKIEN